ncbi:hypothetical protein G6F50_015594 [Rhizopus delemar]|uniref:Uncharacterized protein n=1 Tax=Rhizopus delemar TaxID=936053 RepID=A0A9P6XWY5_9FUNG|nr:hypothetical protein G6F50_015594 [Rhizopus delemar]
MRGRRAQQQGVAVGLGARHEVRTDRRASARLVLHDHGLAQLFLQLARQCTAQHIGGAAGGIGIDQRDRLGRIRVSGHPGGAKCPGGQAAQQASISKQTL